ncbi:MAG: UDP-N-acetylmuramate dehydrogenase [Vicinamibacterales bacterium]
MRHERFGQELLAVIGPERCRAHVSLAELTTFGVGGPAEWLVTVRSVSELAAVIRLAREGGAPVSVLGGGSNVLVPDEGVRGVVLRLDLREMSQPAPDRVRADAGVTMNGLVRWTIGRGLAGLEAWAGTPGTVGGAIYGNAHFGGANIGDLVRQVALVSLGGEVVEAAARDLGFAYDTSRLQRTREVVVWAEFGVAAGDPATLRQTARASLAFRKRTQPLALASAGCVFQNPDPSRDRLPAGVPASAGALVDLAGLKGAREGGAQISSTHANFIVNHGTATARDIRTLIETARRAVRDRFGIELRNEVVMLGDDPPIPQ